MARGVMALPAQYIRVDSGLGANEKLLTVPDDLYLEAAGLYVLILGRCDIGNTDGVLSVRAIVGTRGIAPKRDDLLDALVDAKLVKRRGDSVTVPDYLDWQRSAAEKLSASERARIAARAKHSKRHASTDAETDTSTDADTDAEHLEHLEHREQRERDSARAEVEKPEGKPLTSVGYPPCLNAEIEVIDPAYTGSCWGFIVGQAEAQFGNLLSHADRTELAEVMTRGCIPGCKGDHPQGCAVHVYDKLKLKGKTSFRTSRLWLKCLLEDRMEVRQ